jgi:biotin transport system substrate-specific component
MQQEVVFVRDCHFYLGKSMAMQGAWRLVSAVHHTDLILSVLIAVTSIKVMPVLRRSGLVAGSVLASC